MPLYTYECENCGRIFELTLSLKDHVTTTVCQVCDGDARQILVPGHGGIQDDHPRWLNDQVRGVLQDTDDPGTRPIETRSDYRWYLKDNGIAER
jgi:putative FmdB family regulatory protein